MVHKQFDRDLYQENNDRAIGAVLQYIHEQGLHGSLNEDLYGPDIVVYSGFRKVSYIECEIKRQWNGDFFPFTTIHLPERKGKYLRLRHPVEFWILNSTLDAAVIIPESSIANGKLVEVPNVLIESGERFYQVPIDECNVIQLGGE